MNKIILSLVLGCAMALACTQEPPGCSVKTASSKSKSQLKSSTKSKSGLKGKLPAAKSRTTRSRARKDDDRAIPLIASPIYFPQSSSGANTAITASNGYLFVVVGNRLYKVSEKSMKTIEVTTLSASQVARSTTAKTRTAVAKRETSTPKTRFTKPRVTARTTKIKRG